MIRVRISWRSFYLLVPGRLHVQIGPSIHVCRGRS